MRTSRTIITVILVMLLLLAATACKAGEAEERAGAAAAGESRVGSVSLNKEKSLEVGFSIASFQEERWLVDRDIFIAKCNELGAEVILQSANGNADLQVEQCMKLLAQDIDVLVIISQDGEKMASVVSEANKRNIPVVAYDRLIRNCNIDGYVSYDNIKIGEMQASYLVEKAPKGKYILLGGAQTDYCSVLIREGQMKVLKPYINRGDIKVVEEEWVEDWNPSVAREIVEGSLSANRDNIKAVVASNDGTAGGAIKALAEYRLAGKVAVSGQDADLAGCQRIVEGSQSMTVYVPIKAEAEGAAMVAVKLAKGESFTGNSGVDNGRLVVPTLLLTPISVDKDNIISTVVKDGYQKFEEVYKNIPEDKRPAQR